MRTKSSRWLGIGISSILAVVLTACVAGPSSTHASRVERPADARRHVDLAITGVTVIDPLSRQVLARQTVYIEGKTIVAVQPSGRRAGYVARRTVDGEGRFLIPGLMDMHFHLFLPENPTPSLNLLLANGITTIREMSSDCWAPAGATQGCIAEYKNLQARIGRGEVAGPELAALTGPMIMGRSRAALPSGAPSFVVPVTDADGRAAVRFIADRGIQLIKTHDSIPNPAFAAVMEEAGRLGLSVGGHVPFAAGSVGAARLGYASIEHARDLLYDCSLYGAEYRRQEAAFAEGVPGARRPVGLERLTRTVSEYDPFLCTKMLGQLAELGTFYVPTHVTREMEARAGEPAYRNSTARRYVMPERNARWETDLDETAALPAEERRALAGFFEHGLRITGMAHRAGIPVMAGTDANDTMIVPGFSLHRELSLLHRAGLSNMDVLRAATAVPAAYLGRSPSLGSIAPGREADLVLLRANPLEDIANTSAIESVIVNGRLYSRADLDALIATVERLASASSSR